jgi:hypothetical protein
VEALREKERQDENCWKNESRSLFVKFSFPVTRLMPYYGETDSSHPIIMELYGYL